MAEPPLHREVVVAADPATAFRIFTDRIGEWWPLAGFGVFGDGSVAFEDGRLVERSADGREAAWSEVLAWEPPARLAMTWHPAAAPGPVSEVEVRFEPVGGGTRVVLIHAGWEAYAEAAAARAEYGSGWPRVLGAYAALTGAARS